MSTGPPDDLPTPVPAFAPSGDVDDPPRHVYATRNEAAKVADRIPGETRVSRRKIDGRQRAVIERKAADENADGIRMEAWVEASYDETELV